MMRRSPMKRGTSTLKRTAFARVEWKEGQAVAKLRIKSSRPTMTPIRRAARGQECTLQFPAVCNFDPATTVLCHSNYLADGKGMGLKAPDTVACFGCAACHDLLDGRRLRPADLSLHDVESAFYAGVVRTHQILRALGLMAAAPTNFETEKS